MLVQKPTSWFKADPDQPRKAFDEAELRTLGESMRTVGQLQPVGAKPDGTLIWGERRLRAAVLTGIPELTVSITDRLKDKWMERAAQLIENMQRADLTTLEQVNGVEEYARLNPQTTNKDIAAGLSIDPGMVTRYRTVAASPVAMAGLADGTLKGITDAYAVAKAPAEQQQGLLELRRGGAKCDQLEAAARKPRPSTPAVKLARVRLPLSTGTTVVVSGAEMTLEEMIDDLSAALDAARKANKDSLDVRTAEKVWRDKAKAGV